MPHTPLHTRTYHTRDVIIESTVWGIAAVLLGFVWYLLMQHEVPTAIRIASGALCIWTALKAVRHLRTLSALHIPAFTVSRAGLTFADGSTISWHAIERSVADPTSGAIVLFLKSNNRASLRDRIRLGLANSLYRLSPFIRGKNVVIIRPLLDGTDEILALIESLLP